MSSKNTSATIATIIVAVLAVGVSIFAITRLLETKNPDEPIQTVYHQTEDEKIETQEAAKMLINSNFTVMRLYITDGLPHKNEPYGNDPEDGIYTVDKTYSQLKEILYPSNVYGMIDDDVTDDVKNGTALYSQIENYVKETFVDDEANRILTNIDGNGLAVYSDREGALGISMNFSATENPYSSTEDLSLSITQISETECSITVSTGGETISAENSDVSDTQDQLVFSMIKIDDGWKLKQFVY